MKNQILKESLNHNIHLSEGNIKSKNTDEIVFLTWSLPSKISCPYRTKMCEKRCFAKKNETFQIVRDSRQRNLDETKKATFVQDMINVLEYQLRRPKMKDKRIFVRIHTSGDFYNFDYFCKWVEISNHFKGNKKILFQAYTKSILYLYEWIKDNFADYEVHDYEVESALEELNIHIVYSIWKDTEQADIDLAENLGLQTFTALPKNEIQEAANKGYFECLGDCGNCRQCYTGSLQNVVIPYH